MSLWDYDKVFAYRSPLMSSTTIFGKDQVVIFGAFTSKDLTEPSLDLTSIKMVGTRTLLRELDEKKCEVL